MKFREVTIDEFELEVEIGLVPRHTTTKFLSLYKISTGNKNVNLSVRRIDYEEFLLHNLVKDYKLLEKDMKSLDSSSEKKLLKIKVLEKIYLLNSKLRPTTVIVTHKGLIHRMDSVREGGPSEPVLTANPAWLDGSRGESELYPDLVQEVIDNIWDIAKKDGKNEYVKEHVSSIGMGVPIIKLSDTEIHMDMLVTDYVMRKCDGNIFLASNDQRLWVGYILAYTIPSLNELLEVLTEANYLATYTENIIYTQLYMASLRVNPDFSWDKIDWDNFAGGDEEGVLDKAKKAFKKDEEATDKKVESSLRRINSKTPLTRKRSKTSKEEAEAEKPKFTDVSYEKILGLADDLKKRIIGQDKSVDSLCEAISVSRVGLRGEKRPIGSFLFTGRTGVGKTELSKVLADELTEGSLIRIDCSEYQQAHEIAKIFGAPPGYIGFEDEGRGPHQGAPPTTVSSKLRDKPFSVVLFDEIEKADPAINNVLLQIMDEGHVTSGRGETISFNNAVVILTSNVGSAEAEEARDLNKLGFGEDDRDFDSLTEEVIQDSIKKRFKPEFRNRLTEIIVFNSLTKEVCKGIVDVLLSKTKENLEKAQHISFLWDDTVRDYILESGYSEEFGAREIMRVIQKQVELPLAKHILSKKYVGGTDDLPAGTTIYLSMDGDDLKFNEVPPDGKETDIKPIGILDTKTAEPRFGSANVD